MPDITIYVQDFAQTNRSADPVTFGVPIDLSWTGLQWLLLDGDTEIPLQTTVLTHRSNPWLLLDFQTTLSLSQRKQFILRSGTPTAVHAKPLSYTENASTITVTTGQLKTEIGKNPFNLLDGVWWDADADGDFEAGERLVASTATPQLTVRQLGVDYSGRSSLTSMTWEYQGALRGTLRVEGQYLDGITNIISYTTRFTWYAGKSYVKIDHLLRNSFAAQERYVKLTDAKLSLGGASSWTAISKPGDLLYSYAPTGTVGMNLIPATFVVTKVLGDRTSNITVTTADNSGMIIGDLSHHGATWVVDFQPSVSGGEQLRRNLDLLDPLIVLTDAERYASFNAFGLQNMSTWEDEKQAYTRWGWTWPVAGNEWSVEHDDARQPTLYASHRTLSCDLESDDLWMNICMLARVQRPIYLDRARTWARYCKSEYSYRTDGFDYNGSWSQAEFEDGPGVDTRETTIFPTMTADDTDYVDFNIQPTKPTYTHLWIGGMIDYYYLTGDVDSLTAALDIAEKCEQMVLWKTLPSGGPGGNQRGDARQLLALTRAWEATSNARWKAAADHILDLFMTSPRWDSRGFYYRTALPAYPGGKELVPWFDGQVVEAFYRYYLATGDAAVKARIIQIAEFGYANGLDPVLGYTGEIMVMDWPNAGDVTHFDTPEYNGEAETPFTAGTTSSYVNPMVIHFRFNGNAQYMDRAKLYWSRASKRHYEDPYTQLLANDTQVGKFVNSFGAQTPNETYPEQGYWLPVSLLFSTTMDMPLGQLGDAIANPEIEWESNRQHMVTAPPKEWTKYVGRWISSAQRGRK